MGSKNQYISGTEKIAKIGLDAEIKFDTVCIKGTGKWIGHCKSLGIIVEGDSLDEVHGSAKESLSLLFYDLIVDGELESFLNEFGWSLTEPVPNAVDKPDHIQVPWTLSARETYENFEGISA